MSPLIVRDWHFMSRREKYILLEFEKVLILAGLEPAIPWFVVRCLIHWATGPYTMEPVLSCRLCYTTLMPSSKNVSTECQYYLWYFLVLKDNNTTIGEYTCQFSGQSFQILIFFYSFSLQNCLQKTCLDGWFKLRSIWWPRSSLVEHQVT